MRALGAEPTVLDVLDARAVGEAVAVARPDAIVHEATALADLRAESTATPLRTRESRFAARGGR